MASSWISVAKEEPLVDAEDSLTLMLPGRGLSRDLIPATSSMAPESRCRPIAVVMGGLILMVSFGFLGAAVAAFADAERKTSDTSRIQTLVSENPELQAAYTADVMPGPPRLEGSSDEHEAAPAAKAPPPAARIDSSPVRRENTESGKCSVYRCVDFNPKHSCQCNEECERFQSCCSDFKYTCLNNVNLPGFRKFLQGQ
mmetsp:Transcript_45511/g.97558  ORF Transcript_45511/g.97558 Transcript_45511/m.97558 type:complete len:199 (+) Transcript_45511:132-728(+)